MQFHNINKQGEMPKIGDVAIVSMKQSMGDSLYYSSENEENGTIELEVTNSSFVGTEEGICVSSFFGFNSSTSFFSLIILVNPK